MLAQVAASAASGAKTWNTLYQQFEEGSGSVILEADSAAIASVDESAAGLVSLNADSGKITVYSYDSTGRRT